jgi:hypothetical protein
MMKYFVLLILLISGFTARCNNDSLATGSKKPVFYFSTGIGYGYGKYKTPQSFSHPEGKIMEVLPEVSLDVNFNRIKGGVNFMFSTRTVLFDNEPDYFYSLGYLGYNLSRKTREQLVPLVLIGLIKNDFKPSENPFLTSPLWGCGIIYEKFRKWIGFYSKLNFFRYNSVQIFPIGLNYIQGPKYYKSYTWMLDLSVGLKININELGHKTK